MRHTECPAKIGTPPHILTHWLGHRYDALGAFARLGPNRFAITLGAVSAVALAFVQLNAAPFIYFQF